MADQRKCENDSVPALRFEGFSDPWEQRRLGELFVESEDRSSDLEILSVSVANGIYPASDSDREINPGASLVNYKVVRKGDVVYNSMRMWQGAVDSSLHDGIVSPAYVVARPVSMTASRFFARLLKRPNLLCQYQRRSQGNSKDTQVLKFEEFAEIEVSVPLFRKEQEAIGSLADALDSLITLHQRKVDKLKTVKQSLLEKMFPREGENVPEIRFEGFTDPWEQRAFCELVERRNSFSDDKGLPRVEYEDIVSGQGTLNNDVFSKNDKRGGIAFEPNDVLYGKLRPYLRNWLNPQFRGIALGDFWVLNPISVNSSFLFTLIRTSAFERVANESTGTKMPRADWQNVSSAEFAAPVSGEEQQRIGALFAKLDSLITLHQRELEILKNLKQACLEKMFV